MNCSTPGLPVYHQFPEFTQIHVHRVSDAIQPSHPWLSPSSPAFNPFQHQSLFQWSKMVPGKLGWVTFLLQSPNLSRAQARTDPTARRKNCRAVGLAPEDKAARAPPGEARRSLSRACEWNPLLCWCDVSCLGLTKRLNGKSQGGHVKWDSSPKWQLGFD